MILVHTHIGYGSPNKQDTFEAHGSPLGKGEVNSYRFIRTSHLATPKVVLTIYYPAEARHFEPVASTTPSADRNRTWGNEITPVMRDP